MKSKTHFFDTRAENWEETCYPAPVRERLLDLIREFEIGSGERILDVGTGPGVLLPYLRQGVGPSGQVCAFDLSIDMIRQAHGKPHAPQDLVLQADVHSIPFTDRVFHRVICFAAFPHFDDPGQALQEMGRVLKAGGVLIVAHLMSRKELAAHHRAHDTVARDLLPPHHEMKGLFVAAGLSEPDIVD
ncbi:MAG: class I SAM-dependent methyltransferase, partial [Candidatus Desulfacyla sp.]